jgi:hypothetical protein
LNRVTFARVHSVASLSGKQYCSLEIRTLKELDYRLHLSQHKLNDFWYPLMPVQLICVIFRVVLRLESGCIGVLASHFVVPKHIQCFIVVNVVVNSNSITLAL